MKFYKIKNTEKFEEINLLHHKKVIKLTRTTKNLQINKKKQLILKKWWINYLWKWVRDLNKDLKRNWAPHYLKRTINPGNKWRKVYMIRLCLIDVPSALNYFCLLTTNLLFSFHADILIVKHASTLIQNRIKSVHFVDQLLIQWHQIFHFKTW